MQVVSLHNAQRQKKGINASRGNKLLNTELARNVVDSLSLVVISPVLTTLYEQMPKGIESGEEQISNYMTKQEAFIHKQVVKAGKSISKRSLQLRAINRVSLPVRNISARLVAFAWYEDLPKEKAPFVGVRSSD